MQQEAVLAPKSLRKSELYETILVMKMNSLWYCAFGDTHLPSGKWSREAANHTTNEKTQNTGNTDKGHFPTPPPTPVSE